MNTSPQVNELLVPLGYNLGLHPILVLTDEEHARLSQAPTALAVVSEFTRQDDQWILEQGLWFLQQYYWAVYLILPTNKKQVSLELYKLGVDHIFYGEIDIGLLSARLAAVISHRAKNCFNERGKSIPRNFEDLQSDSGREAILVGGRDLALTKAEFLLLSNLLIANGELLSKDALGQKLWGWDSDYYHDNLKCHISRIRAKLRARNSSVDVEAVRGRGYRLIKHHKPSQQI